AIVETLEDIVEFAKFLFDLDDIQRTQDVFQHVTTLYLKDQVAYLPTIRKEFDSWINSLVREIDAWVKMKGDEFKSLKPMTGPINQLQSSAQPAAASASGSFF